MSTGVFSSNLAVADSAKKSFAGMITRLAPNGSSPLFAISSMLGTETAVAVEHGFFSKTMLFPSFTVTAAGQTAADTIFNGVSTANLLPGMILQVDTTKENLIVNSVINATSISVQRGIGIAAQAIGASVTLQAVGNAYEEGSFRPNSLIINPVRISNLTQIFRNTWAITDTMRQTMMIAGESNLAESRQDCALFHAADIEKSIIFGQKSQGTRNGAPFRTMDGLIAITSNLSYYPSSYSAANVTIAGGTTNFTQLENALDPVFNQTTDPKVANTRTLFVGGQAKRVITAIARLNSSYQITSETNFWGLKFNELKTSRGTFNVIEHPLFNSNANWSKMAVAVDLSTFKLAYLGDRKTQNKEFNADSDANDNGIDSVGGTLTTELTCLVKNPPANAVIYNLTAGQAG